jgi:hypothetical protein
VAAIKKLPSGSSRVQIRRKGHYLSSSFLLRKDAEAWARRMESEIDQGKTPTPKRVEGINNLADLIDLHIDDMKSVGRAIGRSKSFAGDPTSGALGRKLEKGLSGVVADAEGVRPTPRIIRGPQRFDDFA